MPDGLDEVRALLPTVPLEVLDQLGGSNRSNVRRVGRPGETLIVKEFVGADEGWIRESAALSVMPVDAPAPRLVTARAVPPLVVMSDAGPGSSVADALLGSDPAVAANAVVAWATAIAALHRTTAGLRETFQEALAARAGDRAVLDSTVAADLDDAARAIARYCAELDVDLPAGALDELRGLGSRLDGTGPAALTPADACPDNNVSTPDGLILLDFEGAQWRHVAWDLAYLVVPWPSCWCSWRIPGEVAARAIDAYRTHLAWPYADSREFERDLAVAAVGWAFMTTAWFLPRVLPDEPRAANAAKPTPARRARVLHRLRESRESAELPALAELADRLASVLAERWQPDPVAYAPAFAGS